MGVGQILRDFSGWTSAHGIPHIGSAQNLCLKLFWTVVFLASTGMFIFQMTLLIEKYLAFDVTVQTELKFEERHFPAVTVCNLNPYKNSNISLAPEINFLMINYTEAITEKAERADPNNHWGFHGLNDSIAIQSRARDLLMFLASDLRKRDKTLINKITYDMEDFILNCAFNTESCNMKADFQKTIDPIYGACYTFNNDKSTAKIYRSTRAGPLYGLRLLLKSEQKDYLPITESAGVRVSVHGQQEEPFPDAFGYNAAAGFTTSFGIKFIRTTRLPSPYGNCTSTGNFGSFYYKGTYSVEGCFRSCFQEHIKSKCQCYDPRFGSPSQDYCKAGNRQQENTMLIEVYYERMNYQHLSESEAYMLVNLVSDMGGQLGLWMGISVITMIEFFSLLVLLCLYCMAKRKEPTFDDDDDMEKRGPDEGPPPPYAYEDDVSDFSAPPRPK